MRPTTIDGEARDREQDENGVGIPSSCERDEIGERAVGEGRGAAGGDQLDERQHDEAHGQRADDRRDPEPDDDDAR